MTGGGSKAFRGLMRLGSNAPSSSIDRESLAKEVEEAGKQITAL